MFSAWLKLLLQGDLRFRLGFTLCLFLSEREHLFFFFISVYKCLCGIRERENERWSERSPLHTGSEMGIWERSRLKSLFLCQECAGQGGDAVTFF